MLRSDSLISTPISTPPADTQDINDITSITRTISKIPKNKKKSLKISGHSVSAWDYVSYKSVPVLQRRYERYLLPRSTTNFEKAHFKISTEPINLNNEVQKIRCRYLALSGALEVDIYNDGVLRSSKTTYNGASPPTYGEIKRCFPKSPEHILDAPNIINNIFLNLLDWSAKNILAVSLDKTLYLLYSETGCIDRLLTLTERDDYICSVSWLPTMNHILAIGTKHGVVQLWDIDKSKCIRKMKMYSTGINSLSWNSYVLTSGCTSGQIVHHDVRVANFYITALDGHAGEVCGLKWCPNGRYLASSGTDKLLNIWSGVGKQTLLHKHGDNKSVVKALVWSPLDSNILVSGAGKNDRRIRFWNCFSGRCEKEFDTDCQITSLLYSTKCKELISGQDDGSVTVWNFPRIQKITELTGHNNQILHLALSATEERLMSVSGDETLRFWNYFGPSTTKKKPPQRSCFEISNFCSRL